MESLAPIVSYILEGEFPQSFTKAQKQRLMEKASSYLFLEGALYQRGKDQVCRRIPTVEEIPSILEGLHEEACGGHFAQQLTAKKILLSGYVRPSLHIDVQHWCKSCHNCQVNENKHLLHGPRQLVLANGPFEKWGIDAMGPLPRTKNGKFYILVAIDYMTRFGTPLEIVFDNGPGFRKGLLTEVSEELHILHRHSTPYYPQSNGLVEKANGIIAGIIRKMVKNKTKLWDDFLDGALWAYRTTYKEATEFTPFHLVYGQEALQPIELNIPTMRLHGKAAQRKEEEWTDRLLTLAELEWKREAAYECYKRKATQVKDKLDKEVKDKGIKEGDLVLRYDNRLDNCFDAKFETRWQGPYIVKNAFNSSYYQFMDLDEKEHPRKVNGYRLKPYLSQILPKDLQDQRQKSTLSHKSCSLVQFGEADGERVQVSFYRSYGKTFKKPRRRGPRYEKEQRLNMNAELMLVGDQHAWARQDEKNARRMFRSILILPCQGGRVLKAASKKAAGSKLVGGCCGGVFVNYLQRFNEFAKGFPHIPLEPLFQKEDVNGNAPISTELEKVQHSGASMESFKSDEEDEDNDYDDTVFHEDCFSGYAVDQRDEGTADNCMSHFAAMDVAIDSKDSFQAAMTKMNRELIALYESRSRTEKKNSQEALRKKLKELLEPVTGVMKSQGERVEAAMSILKSSTGRSRRCQLEKFYGDFGEADGERVQVSFYRSYGKTFKKPCRRGPRYEKEQRLNMNAELMLVGDQLA
ncbi:hypothetical protein L7F22_005178 [Adiantum nelumboides]|nr:hypothetical protein [Adiantum nelumboides]